MASDLADKANTICDRSVTVAKRRQAAVQLGEAGADALPELLRLLEDEHRHLARVQARLEIYTLAATGLRVLLEHHSELAGQVVEALAELLNRGTTQQRQIAADVLGQVEGGAQETADGILIAHLDDQERTVREKVVTALGRSGNRSAVPLLIEMLRAQDMVLQVASALGAIGDPLALDILTELITDPATPEDYVLAITRAIGRIGGAKAMPGLEAAAERGNAVTRGHVARYMERIAVDHAEEDLRAHIVRSLIPLLEDEEKVYLPELRLMTPRLHFIFPGASMHGKRVCDIAAGALRQIGTSQALSALEAWQSAEEG